jgi:hypothetical protein
VPPLKNGACGFSELFTSPLPPRKSATSSNATAGGFLEQELSVPVWPLPLKKPPFPQFLSSVGESLWFPKTDSFSTTGMRGPDSIVKLYITALPRRF